MKKLNVDLKRYKSVFAYLFFGICTTLVNIAVYFICSEVLGGGTILSTCIAWLLSVLFAYITNKLYVFDSKSFNFRIVEKEIISFFGCRFATGVMDILIMYIAVDLFHQNGMIWKIISNILVIVINYFASKILIFKKS